MIIAHLQGLILHSLKSFNTKWTCSSQVALHMLPLMPDFFFLTVSFVTWLDRDTALTYYSYGHGNRYGIRGQARGQVNVGPFPPAGLMWWTHCWPGYLPNRCGVLIGWLSAWGKWALTVNIYREESMVTLARSEKGLGGRKWERKGKKVLARQLSPAKKLQGESFPFFYFCF